MATKIKATDKRRKYKDGYKKTTRKTQKYEDLWNQIYEELDSSIDFAITNRELFDPQSSRYNYNYLSVTPSGYIAVSTKSLDELDFARRVAKHYNVGYEEVKDKYTSDPNRLYIGILKVSEDMKYIMKN